MKHKTASIAVVAALALGGGAAACGGGGDDQVSPTPTLTGMEGVSPPTTPPQTTSPPPQTPRELKVGQKITATTEDGPAEITLLAVDNTTAIGDSKPDSGQQFVVYSMRVKNLGSTAEWDTYWLGSPRWSGSDGEADSPVFVAGPTDPELIPYDPFSSTPNPRPGEHINATQTLQVPNISGALQFEDEPGNAQFDIVVK
ncbi:hypothetical protein [Streptomyces violaceus]|uniref:DUF4352 domain-containing protein n=1 Tax=Streptomyces violaceus TaxID=1936 RepID=A0ABY9U5G2_STRVL|nr:hypothetical protein [Streptomyces janthinus]WND17547.1 hypothetical protein RI060_09410 [Streptomyces janthinus]GGS37128.1 hypothetical protein GCM10010270_02860 [Streptomyces janthinus]